MKRLIALLFVMIMVFSLAACKNDSAELQRLYDDIKDAYKAFTKDQADFPYDIEDVIFDDGDNYYAVEKRKVVVLDDVDDDDLWKSDRKYYGFYICVEEDDTFSSIVEETNKKSRQAEIKNAYSKFVADRALENQLYNAIGDYVYYDGENFYTSDGEKYSVNGTLIHLCDANGWGIYEVE